MVKYSRGCDVWGWLRAVVLVSLSVAPYSFHLSSVGRHARRGLRMPMHVRSQCPAALCVAHSVRSSRARALVVCPRRLEAAGGPSRSLALGLRYVAKLAEHLAEAAGGVDVAEEGAKGVRLRQECAHVAALAS